MERKGKSHGRRDQAYELTVNAYANSKGLGCDRSPQHYANMVEDRATNVKAKLENSQTTPMKARVRTEPPTQRRSL